MLIALNSVCLLTSINYREVSTPPATGSSLPRHPTFVPPPFQVQHHQRSEPLDYTEDQFEGQYNVTSGCVEIIIMFKDVYQFYLF